MFENVDDDDFSSSHYNFFYYNFHYDFHHDFHHDFQHDDDVFVSLYNVSFEDSSKESFKKYKFER